MKTAVVGAGILGINTAYYLAKKGHDVVVFESKEQPGMDTSYSNGGQISASSAEMWTKWDNVKKGIGWMFKQDAPLLFNPTPNFFDLADTFSKYMWMTNFFYTSISGKYKINSENAFEISVKSRELYFEIAENENIDFDLARKGAIQIFDKTTDFENAKSKKEWIENMGCEWKELSKEEVFELEPALNRNKVVAGAIYTESDASGDIHKYCVNLGDILASKYGVSFRFNEQVKDIHGLDAPIISTDKDEMPFDKVVICAGVKTQEFRNKFGDDFRIYPVKGYSITVDLDDDTSRNAAPHVSIKDDHNKIVSSRLGNRLRVAGTAELAGENKEIRKERIAPLVKWINDCFPEIKTDNFVPWAGLRPMTSDMVPVMKESKRKNVFYNSGHGHLGWTMGAFAAKFVSDLIES